MLIVKAQSSGMVNVCSGTKRVTRRGGWLGRLRASDFLASYAMFIEALIGLSVIRGDPRDRSDVRGLRDLRDLRLDIPSLLSLCGGETGS